MSPLKVTLLLSLVWVNASLDKVQAKPSAAKDAHVKKHAATHFAKNVQFQHRIRVCNAYPSDDGLDIFKGREAMMSNIRRFRGETKLTSLPLEYKMCGDFHAPLLAGDQIKFTLGGAAAGNFEISDLPNNDAVLLLVVHRHSVLTNAVAFQSHVFANLLNAQLAVIDTYKGRARTHVQIADVVKAEDLKYNQLVALDAGLYKINLVDNHKKVKTSKDFVALSRESYVALRVGVEPHHESKFPEELVVYPASDPLLLLGNSPRSSAPIGMLMMALVIVALRQ